MMTATVVIAGAGQAGAWAARTLREEGHTGPVILIGDECHPPYERPPLSKAILLETGTEDELWILGSEEASSLNLDLRLGRRVVKLDRQARQLTLDNGEQLAYDKLILSTGGRARRLDIPGLDNPEIHTLRTLDDARRLKAALGATPGHVLIVGGGWIGLEVAASARSLGAQVTLLEAAGRLCARSVPADMSQTLHDLHSRQQVRLKLNTFLQSLTPADKGFAVTLSDGEQLECQHVILAAGLVANDELAQAAGVVCANGIVVDRQCRSSDPDIYAAGDVAVLETSLSSARMRLESWQNAQDQGIAVAKAILGDDAEYLPVPMVWSEQFDQFIQICGHVNAGVHVVERRTSSGNLRFYLDADKTVIGVIGINAGRDFRFARQMVERRATAAAEDLADTSKPLKNLATATAAA